MAIAYELSMKEVQFIDIRSPREFNTGTIPGAVNLPLFLDETYETVGTVYKQKGPEQAKKVAMKFVAERLPEIYEQFLEIEAQGKPMVMFCARGGMRSKTLKNMLSNLGHKLERLEGGYKAYRQVIINETEAACKRAQMIVLHGMTGVGKTQILKALEAKGAKMIDIEGISEHRGSMLGRIGLPEQPNQRAFEHMILEALLAGDGQTVYVEAESKRLGRNTLPEAFMAAMRRGGHIDLTASIAFRKGILIEEYAHCSAYIGEMIEVLNGFRKQLGNGKVNELQEKLKQGDLASVAEILMVEYYDPKYKHASLGVIYDAVFEIQSIEETASAILAWQSKFEQEKAAERSLAGLGLNTRIIDLDVLKEFEAGSKAWSSAMDRLLMLAADQLKAGETVAFPTETVYGIGADALNPNALAKIYEAKGRPSDNPLILHIAHMEDLEPLVSEVSDMARQLMEAFWPGALTLIFPKSEKVPMVATAGLSTVAIRMPSHPVARRLIELSGCAVAAPSANLSGKPSPTCGRDVVADLTGRVSVIVCGEDAQIGLESTVLDVTGNEPVVLRPGGVTLEAIRSVVGCGRYDEKLNLKLQDGEQPRSPGMKYTHYAPEAEVTVYCGAAENVKATIQSRIAAALERGIKPGVLSVEEVGADFKGAEVLMLGSWAEPDVAASRLFKLLRDFDLLGVQEVYAVGFDETGLGKAIMNRLIKAAGHRVNHV